MQKFTSGFLRQSFNPRAREGRDIKDFFVLSRRHERFNPRAREGRDYALFGGCQ